MMAFDVVDLAPTSHPEPGDEAPDFTRPLVTPEYWEDRSLSELTDDGRVILVFTPMNRTFLATHTWEELKERGWDDRKATVVGVSISTPYAHKRLIDEYDLPFPIFSDPANEVAETYGVGHDLDGMTGISEPRLAVFVLESDRTISHAWVADEWPEFPDYDEIEDALASA